MCKVFFVLVNQDRPNPLLSPDLLHIIILPMEKVHIQGCEEWCKQKEGKAEWFYTSEQHCFLLHLCMIPLGHYLIMSLYDSMTSILHLPKLWLWFKKKKVFQKFLLLLRKVILKILLKILNCSTVILCINSLNKLPKVRTMETCWKPSFKNYHEIIEPQNNWVWKGPLEGFSPTSCSKKGEVRPGFSVLYLVASWKLSRMETA